MSFTLQLWQKSEHWPWPSNYKEADAQIARLFARPKAGRNPRFLEFGRALHERFPQRTGVWLDGSEAGETDEPVLVFGIATRHEDFDQAYLWAVEVAGRLGLVLTDPQTGDSYLPDGRVIDADGTSASGPPGLGATEPSLRDLGWDALRSAATERKPGALFELGRRLRYGIGQRRHLLGAYALLRLGASDAGTRAEADERWAVVEEAQQPRLYALHDRLAAAEGPRLLEIIDAERQALDEVFAKGCRELLDSRTWEAGLDHIRDAAGDGHEEAAYWMALCAAVTHTPPAWKSFDTWSRLAAEWGHRPAMELRHHVLSLGIAQAEGRPDGAKAAWWRDQLGAPPREWPQEGEPLAQVTAWYAREGMPLALFTRGVQFDHGRAGLPEDPQRAFDCYLRAAEAGHANSLYNIAVELEEKRAPRPLVIALYMIAHSRGARLRANGLNVGASDKEAVRKVMRDLLRPGQLRPVIEAQARLPSPTATVPAPAVQKPAPRLRQVEEDEEAPAEFIGGEGSGASRLWLAPALLAAPVALSMARPGPGFRLALFIAALLGAWGVWRFTSRGDWSWPTRLVLSLMAAFPLGGIVVGGLLLARSFRS